MSTSPASTFWLPDDQGVYADHADKLNEGTIYRPEFLDHVTATLAAMDEGLWALSHDIHGEMFLRLYISDVSDRLLINRSS